MTLKNLFLAAAIMAPALAVGTARADDIAPIALNSLSAAPSALATAQVYDEHGQVIGHVARVENDAEGKPAALLVQPVNGKPVVVAAGAVSYDEPHNILITSLDPQRLAAN